MAFRVTFTPLAGSVAEENIFYSSETLALSVGVDIFNLYNTTKTHASADSNVRVRLLYYAEKKKKKITMRVSPLCKYCNISS